MSERGRWPRRARLLLLIVASMAAAGVVAVGAVGGGSNPDVRNSNLELGGDAIYSHGPKAHRATSAVARYDARVRARCARPAYRRAHRMTCPSISVYGAARRALLRRSAGAGVLRSFAVESPTTMGQWSARFPAAALPQTPAVPVHAVLLPTGKILMFGPTTPRTGNESTAFLLDPVTQAITEVPPPIDPNTGRRYNIWCAGQTLLANGTVLVAGGNLAYQDSSNNNPISATNPAGWKGLNRLFTFNPWTNAWTDQGAMDRGRWYPTAITLADGRAMVYGGWDETGTNTYARDILLFTPNPTNLDGKGTIEVKTSTKNPGLYPRLTVLPDGNVLMAGPRESDYFVLNTTTWTWGSKPSNTFSRRYWGSEVLMPFGPAGPSRIMRIGGADATNSAQAKNTPFIDLAGLAAGEQTGPSMASARAHLNTVLLPDDSIFAVGGGLGDGSGIGLDGGTGLYAGAVFTSELYNPQTNTWSLGATQAEPRTYHSVALLLPDGTVLSGGDDRNAVAVTNTDQMEIYSPPYLFKGARPAISSAPSSVGYGASFTVATPDAASVTKAVLIRAGAVTHAFDNDQRSITLTQTPVAGGLSLTAPANSKLAPPGYYMLFLVNSQGVPSTATFVNVGGPDGPPPPVNQAPLASFTVSAAPTAGAPVTFTDTSTDPDGSIASRAWDTDNDGAFDDGTGATAQATFATSGTYTVRLQVTDNGGAPAVASVPVTVQGSGGGSVIPAGNLTQNPGFEVLGTTKWSCYHCTLAQATLADAPEGTRTAQITLNATFTSMALDDSPDTITSTVAAAGYSAKAYVKAAAASSVGKTVRLYLREKDSAGAVVKDTGGTAITLSNTFTPITVTATALAAGHKMDVRVGMSSIAVPTSIYIDAVSVVPGSGTPPPPPPPPPPPVNQPPVASFTVSAAPTAGAPVTFTDTSTDPDGTIASRAWDTDNDGAFDDGTGATAQATFAAAGTYTVRLQATDNGGASAVASVPVTVQASGGGGGGGGGGVTIPAGNLTQNPGFEALGVTKWSCYHCTLAQVTLADAPEGTRTAQITLNATFTSMALDDSPDTITSTVAAAGYSAKAYVKAAAASSVGRTVRLYLREKDSAGAVVKDTGGTAITLSSTFTPITVSATALAAAHKMDVRVGMSSIAVPTSIYIDAVSVTKP